MSSPDATAETDVAGLVARFGHLLHAAGVPVTPERSGRLAAVLSLSPPLRRQELYWMARVTLVAAHEHLEVFDRVFAQVFAGVADPADFRGDAPPPAPVRTGGPRRRGDSPVPGVREASTPAPLVPGDDSGEDGDGGEGVMAAVSADERLRSKDFAAFTPDELLTLRELSARMAFVTPPRRSRRTRRGSRGSRLDVRATLRRARRTGGEPLVAVHRRRRTRPRRLVLLCDISGSMEPYARAYLQLLMSGVGGAHAEAFVFATRLTRLTRLLRTSSPELALRRAGEAAPDWSGGTRIGAAVRAFNNDHGRRGMARGAVVVILSDGWDRGDPAVLGREMERLARLAHRVVWVNPRKASSAYQPLTGGMAAALPFVDVFVSGHSLAAFDEVLAALRA